MDGQLEVLYAQIKFKFVWEQQQRPLLRDIQTLCLDIEHFVGEGSSPRGFVTKELQDVLPNAYKLNRNDFDERLDGVELRSLRQGSVELEVAKELISTPETVGALLVGVFLVVRSPLKLYQLLKNKTETAVLKAENDLGDEQNRQEVQDLEHQKNLIQARNEVLAEVVRNHELIETVRLLNEPIGQDDEERQEELRQLTRAQGFSPPKNRFACEQVEINMFYEALPPSDSFAAHPKQPATGPVGAERKSGVVMIAPSSTEQESKPDSQGETENWPPSGSGSEEIDLSKQDLTGSDLEGRDLRGVDLSNKILRLANLSGANLREVNLSGADLGGADLRGAQLQLAYLKDVHLRGAALVGVDATGANLARSVLRDVDLTGANLTGANLTGANLGGANLTRVTLWRANLTEADLTSSNLRNANLRNADLTNANLQGSTLGGVSLEGAKGLRTHGSHTRRQKINSELSRRRKP